MEPLIREMPDQEGHSRGLRCAPEVEVRFSWSQHKGGARYRANYLPGLREPFKRDTWTWYRGQLKEWAGFHKSLEVFCSTVGEQRK